MAVLHNNFKYSSKYCNMVPRWDSVSLGSLLFFTASLISVKVTVLDLLESGGVFAAQSFSSSLYNNAALGSPVLLPTALTKMECLVAMKKIVEIKSISQNFKVLIIT